jgi:hypothetical protein
MKDATQWLIDLVAIGIAVVIGYDAAEAIGAILAGALVMVYGGVCYMNGVEDAAHEEPLA